MTCFLAFATQSCACMAGWPLKYIALCLHAKEISQEPDSADFENTYRRRRVRRLCHHRPSRPTLRLRQSALVALTLANWRSATICITSGITVASPFSDVLIVRHVTRVESTQGKALISMWRYLYNQVRSLFKLGRCSLLASDKDSGVLRCSLHCAIDETPSEVLFRFGRGTKDVCEVRRTGGAWFRGARVG